MYAKYSLRALETKLVLYILRHFGLILLPSLKLNTYFLVSQFLKKNRL